MEEIGEEKFFELLFIQLIYSFQNLAMISMGKIANPVTNKIEKKLDQAKSAIDMLRMIKKKTENNLNEQERKLIEQTIFDLQLNYADEVKKPQ